MKPDSRYRRNATLDAAEDDVGDFRGGAEADWGADGAETPIYIETSAWALQNRGRQQGLCNQRLRRSEQRPLVETRNVIGEEMSRA